VAWIEDRWHGLATAGSGTWLAWAAWAALALAVIALIYTHRQVRRSRRLAAERIRPHVSMFMEPHPSDWHLIELVVHNFGKTAAHDIRFSFPHPLTVADYEDARDGYSNVVELKLPSELLTLAPGQEWRMVWDSALDRAELGEGIESRFSGTVTYFDRPDERPGWKFWQPRRRPLQTSVVLDWESLPPVHRIELMTTHDRARREKQKLELLRGVLTYFHYASKESRADVLRSEIDRINRVVAEVQERWTTRELDHPTDVSLRWGEAARELGRHREQRV
jgi:hypothetical protein